MDPGLGQHPQPQQPYLPQPPQQQEPYPLLPALAPEPRRRYGLAVLGAALMFSGATFFGIFIFWGAALLGAALADPGAMLDSGLLGLDEMQLNDFGLPLLGIALTAGGLLISGGLLAGGMAAGAAAAVPWRRPLLYRLAAGTVLVAAAGAAGALLGVDAAMQLGILLGSLFALTVMVSYALALRNSPLQFGLLRKHGRWARGRWARGDWYITVGGALGIWLITYGLAFAADALVGLLGVEALQPGTFEDTYGQRDDALNVASLVVAAVVVAPITEEIMFRGVLMKYLMDRIPVAAAVLISSLLFTLIHFMLGASVILFVLSLGMSAAYLLLGLRGAVLMHGIHNTVALLVGLFVPEELLNMQAVLRL